MSEVLIDTDLEGDYYDKSRNDDETDECEEYL